MKKKKLLKTTAAGIISGFVLSGCVFNPEENRPEAVYGPPSSFEYDPEENEPEDVYGPPVSESEETDEPVEYDAEENENPAVYGPPPSEEQAEEK